MSWEGGVRGGLKMTDTSWRIHFQGLNDMHINTKGQFSTCKGEFSLFNLSNPNQPLAKLKIIKHPKLDLDVEKMRPHGMGLYRDGKTGKYSVVNLPRRSVFKSSECHLPCPYKKDVSCPSVHTLTFVSLNLRLYYLADCFETSHDDTRHRSFMAADIETNPSTSTSDCLGEIAKGISSSVNSGYKRQSRTYIFYPVFLITEKRKILHSFSLWGLGNMLHIRMRLTSDVYSIDWFVILIATFTQSFGTK